MLYFAIAHLLFAFTHQDIPPMMNSKQWDGAEYHHHSHIQYQIAQELLKQYSFKGNERILDVGCGNGKITAEIADRVPKGSVLGIDNSVSMISFAQEHFNTSTFQNLDFDVQDAQKLPYREEFDVVFSFCCLHWVKDQLSALQGIHRSLKPSGYFFAVLPHAANLKNAILNTVSQNCWKPYFPHYEDPSILFEVEEYLSLLQAAHLTPISVKMLEKTMAFHHREELLQWLKQLIPHLQTLPQELQDAFINEIIDSLLFDCPHALQSSGAIYLPLPVLEVIAQRLESI